MMFDLNQDAREQLIASACARLDLEWAGRTETIEREVLCFMQGWVDCRAQLVALLGERLLGAVYQAKQNPSVINNDARRPEDDGP